jgi:hypothetical protein
VPDVALIVHVHAALMTAWLILLLAQTASMSMGRRRLHVQLGLFSLALAPAMVVAMISVTLQALTVRLASDTQLRCPTVPAELERETGSQNLLEEPLDLARHFAEP